MHFTLFYKLIMVFTADLAAFISQAVSKTLEVTLPLRSFTRTLSALGSSWQQMGKHRCCGADKLG